MTRILVYIILCFSAACTFTPSAFVCEEGQPPEGNRECQKGVWVEITANSETDGGTQIDGGIDIDGGVDGGEPDVSPQPTCGDDVLHASEQCDTTHLGEETCVGLGFLSGELQCDMSCKYDTSKCEAPLTCNNNVVDPGEECDPSVFNDEDKKCGGNFDGGEIKCTEACLLDTSACSECGNGILEGEEECDGIVQGGCDKDGEAQCVQCQIDKSSCHECGDGILESAEVCDSTDFNGKTCESINGVGSQGELRCADTCQVVNDDDCGVKYTSVSAGRFHTCGVLSDGQVNCWGSNAEGQITPPANERFIEVASGGLHTCGLKTGGEVVCWGANYHPFNQGVVTVNQTLPPPNSNFKKITSGRYHSCGILQNNSVECWGSHLDFFGQTIDQNDDQNESSLMVSAGGFHTCSIRANGKARCWGGNDLDQTNASSDTFTQISSGDYHTCALDTGKVVCWGANVAFGGGGSVIVNQSMPPTTLFTELAAGGFHTCGLKSSDGSVECWGSNLRNQSDSKTGPFRSISAGRQHTCGVLMTGQIECWGRNNTGQINVVAPN